MTVTRGSDGFVQAVDPALDVVSITDADSPYDAEQGEYVNVDASANSVTVRLPTARAGGLVTVNVTAVGVNNVSIFPLAGESINGGLSILGITTLGPVTLRAVRDSAGAFGWRSIK